MTFRGTQHKISEIDGGSELIEEVSSVKYLGWEITYLGSTDMEGKLNSNICVWNN
jgi:hypothetical protein